MRRTNCAVLLCVLLSEMAASADVARGTADAIRLDSRSPRQAVSPCGVCYSPSWASTAAGEGAYVVLYKTELAGRSAERTATLMTGAGGEEGSYAISLGENDERCLRLTHEVRNSGGSVVDTMACDVAFGFMSQSSDCTVDSRTNSLPVAVRDRRQIDMAYSTAWATNAASVSISAVRLSGKGGEGVATNTVFSAVADAEGTTPLRALEGGWWRLLFSAADGSGDGLLEYITDEFRMPTGLFLSFR